MHSKRWNSRTALIIAGVAFLLAGCGGGGGGGGGGGSDAPVQASGTVANTQAAVAALNVDFGNLPDYTPTLPAHYASASALDNTPAGAVSKKEVATLGRVLFFDRRLSLNDTKSCASCHQQSTDFADIDRFSMGFAGMDRTTAHSMRLANLRFWQPGSMFWDRRAASLETQSVMPIQHPVEMGFDASNGGMTVLVDKLRSITYYPELFTLAFGDGTVTEERMQLALAQYMRSIVSVNSRWDSAFAQVFNPSLPDKGLSLPAPGLTAQEDRGRHLFMNFPSKGGMSCAACHVPPTFALKGTTQSNGLDEGETKIFKSPSLKNVANSGAFMHDGRFSTLEEVVEHYATGVKDGPALDKNMRGPDGLPRLRPVTPEDKAALVAFLKTLSDPVLAADPRFSDPFR